MTARRARVVGCLVVAVFAALVTAGCGNLGVADELATRLEYEGHTAVNVSLLSQQDGDVVLVTARGNRTLADEDAAASIGLTVWSTLPRKFDRMEISVGQHDMAAAYQELGQRYGPRDPALDNRPITTNTGKIVVPLGIGAGVLLLAAGLALLYVRRRRQHGRHELGWPVEQAAHY